jgi:hypothetical protein
MYLILKLKILILPMSNKLSREEIEYRFSNWVSMMVDIIKPKNLYFVGGRGTAKTEDIIAKRSIDIIYSMPRATFAFISDTYVNALTNIVPNMMTGWARQGFIEDITTDGNRRPGHFVCDRAPPADFDKPASITLEHKHTISTFNGCRFLIKSLDRPSSNAGISTVHNFGDEAKYHKEDKLKKSFPTLRGDVMIYGHSPYFMGQTFLTDMPNPADGEDDWILRMKNQMDLKQIIATFYQALLVNKIEYEMYCANNAKADIRTIEKISARLVRENERLLKVRRNSTLFITVSSLANIDILTFEYLVTQFNSLEYEEFKTAILSMKASLGIGARFYSQLTDKHFYEDGYNYDYYDQFGLRDNIARTSAGLRYIQHNQPLDAGYDAGNMMSMVIGQEQGHVLRCLKNLYTLSPDWIPELGQQFCSFFEPHKNKVLNLYYDRSANNYRNAKQDYASQMKHAIEFTKSGIRTGWRVNLMSIGQGNIEGDEEYDIMNQMLGEKNPRLPIVLIDKFECRELKSSLDLAPLEKNSRGKIIKVKKSEKLPIKRLPMESTNMSDAYKYLVCNRKRRLLAKQQSKVKLTGITQL